MMHNTENNSGQNFPQSVIWTSRQEFSDLEMSIVEGELPQLLNGHAFFIGPVGSYDDETTNNPFRPSKDGTPLFNGDAMIYRLDFDLVKRETVKLTSQIAKTPCLYADEATIKNSNLKFHNFGLARISFSLGFRNQVNTAFLPMKISEEEGYRLLITWDAGRPYEIDTKSLKVTTPIGMNTEWKEQFPLDLPFQLVNTGAHPAFDPKDKKMYAINYGKSIVNLLGQPEKVGGFTNTLRFIERVLELAKTFGENLVNISETERRELLSSVKSETRKQELLSSVKSENQLPPEYKEVLDTFKRDLLLDSSRRDFENIERLTSAPANSGELLQELINIVEGIIKLVSVAVQIKDFVKLICWDGEKGFRKWDVLEELEEGKVPIRIKETMHQIALTENYIVLMDTVFKVGTEQLFTSILPTKTEYPEWLNEKINSLNQIVRDFLDFKQSDDTFIYVIRRSDLDDPSQSSVIAKKFTIRLSAAHFQADYDDSESTITLHMAHNTAWDPSDWIRPYDQQQDVPPDEQQINMPSKKNLPVGMSPGGMDINRLGKHTINVTTGEVDDHVIDDKKYTWMTAIAAYNCVDGITLPKKFNNIYWISWGAWPDLLTVDIVNRYKEYGKPGYREIPATEVWEIAQQDRPVSLVRLDVNKMTIEDNYLFPPNIFANSPQFIPQPTNESSSNDESMNGYIICVVNIGNDNTQPSQFWIFDAANLQQGPICKLVDSSKQLKVGMTVHSTWLPQIGDRQATYNIPVRADYDPLIQGNQTIKELFEKEVYPHFPSM